MSTIKVKKTAPLKTKRGKKQDARLIATTEKGELRYMRKKWMVSSCVLRAAVSEAGSHDRKKVEVQLLKWHYELQKFAEIIKENK